MHLPPFYAILRALICKKCHPQGRKKTSVDIGKNHMPVQISKFLDFNNKKLSHQLRMTVYRQVHVCSYGHFFIFKNKNSARIVFTMSRCLHERISHDDYSS